MKKQTSELAKQAGLRILLALLGAAEGGQVRGQRAEGGSVLRRAAGGRTTQTNAYLVGERGRELFCEGHRRQDLIRFGKFGNAWWEKPASGAERTTFPIPQWAIDANPNLGL